MCPHCSTPRLESPTTSPVESPSRPLRNPSDARPPNYLRMPLRELRVHANRLYEVLDTSDPPEDAVYEYRLVNSILTLRAEYARRRSP